MIYGERVRYARTKLKLSRMAFANLLESSEGYIRNIEIAKEPKVIRLSREREELITKAADLPPGFFVVSDDEVEVLLMPNEELFYRLFPIAKDKVSLEEATSLISNLSKLKIRE